MIPTSGRLAVAAAAVTERLEEAGATLIRMGPGGLPSLGFRITRWPMMRKTLDGYRVDGAHLRLPVPSASEITRMDEAFDWLRLIPREKYVIRGVVAMRSLVGPITGDHLVSWNEIALQVGARAYALPGWYRRGIEYIVRAKSFGLVANARDQKR